MREQSKIEIKLMMMQHHAYFDLKDATLVWLFLLEWLNYE